MNLKKTLRIDLVRIKNVLDTKSTLEQFALALSELQTAERLTDEDKEVINTALDRFLAANPQSHFPLPTIATVVTNKYLDIPVNLVESTQEKVKAYVRSETDRFFIGKGKNGGCRIVSRMTADEKKKWEAVRAAEKAAELAEAEKAAALAEASDAQ